MVHPPHSRGCRVSVPGRICLFGEHQDYLGLPVIAMAIDLRLELVGVRNESNQINIELLDLKRTETIPLDEGRLPYKSGADFLRSVVNTLMDMGVEIPGVDVQVKSTVPINSGTSSSTALVTAWTQFLLEMAGHPVPREELPIIAHRAEVLEFRAPGGMMDHMSVVHGGIQLIHFRPKPRAEEVKADLGAFVLGDSLEPKDTYGILGRLQYPLQELAGRLEADDLHYKGLTREQAIAYTDGQPELREVLLATLDNRDLTLEAHKALSGPVLDHEEIGRLLDVHQEVLGGRLDVSTPKIDAMLAAAKAAGALGGKINGSGGGGAMFAYAPDNPERVARAIEKSGGRAYVINGDAGVISELLTHVSTLSS